MNCSQSLNKQKMAGQNSNKDSESVAHNIKKVKSLISYQQLELPKDPGDPQLYYKVLDDFESQLSHRKKYLEAEFVKHKKKEIQNLIEQSLTQELSLQQREEDKFIQKAFQQELQNFNEFWARKFEEFEVQTEQLQLALVEKQKEDFEKIKYQLVENMPDQYKESRELIQMKEYERFLNYSKNYIEAHFVAIKIKELKRKEQKKFKKEVQKIIQGKLEQIKFKQQKEQIVLRDKIQQAKEEQKNVRMLDHQKLLKKFGNVKNNLQISQINQKNKLEKTFVSGQLNESKLISNNVKTISPEKSSIKY